MANKSGLPPRGPKSPRSIPFDYFRDTEFHPWEGTKDDLVTPEWGRKIRSVDGDSTELPAKWRSSSPPTFNGHVLRRKPAPGSSKKVLYDDYPGPPLNPEERNAGSFFNEDGEPLYHRYEQDVWHEFPQPQTRFRTFGVRTLKDNCGVPKPYPPC
jgi:hypothetical protein